LDSLGSNFLTVQYTSIDCDKCKYKTQSLFISIFGCIMQTLLSIQFLKSLISLGS
jgi:hypothetical protein